MLLKNRFKIGFTLVFLVITQGFCWNASGHRLIAQIAYDNLTSNAKNIYNKYNHALDKTYVATSLVNAAPWLDSLRYQNNLWLQPMHYIDIPFSTDGSKLIAPDKVNAVYAIKKAMNVLKNKNASTYDKGFSLRILLHVVGDIHQPMHGVSEFSSKFPQGDQGGNLVRLAANPVGKNLHSYWDNGGGWLLCRKKNCAAKLNRQAHIIEKKSPCNSNGADILNPQVWAEESHQLAVNKAYQLKALHKPTKSYQRMVKRVAEQRIALAGCRLALLLNELASYT